MNEIVHGPWAGPPVEQAPELAPRPREWWRRDDHGQLWVWCQPSRRAPCWCPSPVPPARLTGPLPNRAPDPARITQTLDAAGMAGPEVDEALGVHNALDTVVDAWETGAEVPTVEQVRRLATLTGFGPGWFYRGPLPHIEGAVFICKRSRN